MARVDSIEAEIFQVEGFKVEFRHADGRDVRADKEGLPSYPYQKAAWNESRVAQWREKRFKPKYPDYGVRVLLADGSEAHGVTKLATVRESYQNEQPVPHSAPEEGETADAISFVRETSDGPPEVWVVRAGYWGDEEPIALDNNLATIHWNELPNLCGVESKEALAELYLEVYPDDNARVVGTQVAQVWAFRDGIKKGDLVILPLVRMWHAVAIGEATGPYSYRTDLGKEVLHTLPVDWLIADLPRSRLDPDLAKALGRPPTVYRIKTPPDAERRFRAILCDEIERRQRRILGNNPPLTARILHRESTQSVRLYTLPRAEEIVRLRPAGSTEPHCFCVESVIHDIDGETGLHTIEISVEEVASVARETPPCPSEETEGRRVSSEPLTRTGEAIQYPSVQGPEGALVRHPSAATERRDG